LNWGPTDYESVALPTELCRRDRPLLAPGPADRQRRRGPVGRRPARGRAGRAAARQPL